MSLTQKLVRVRLASLAISALVAACEPSAKPVLSASDNPVSATTAVPAGYKYISTYPCSGRMTIMKLLPMENDGASATQVAFRQDNYFQYRASIVDGLNGYSANNPSLLAEFRRQLNSNTSYINVTVRAVAASGTPDVSPDNSTLQFTPIINAKKSTGLPADAFVAPSSYIFGPYVIASQNPMRFDIAYSYGESTNSVLPELIVDALQAGVAATGVSAIPVVAANAIKGVTAQRKKDANTWFDNALTFDANKAAKPQCPINFSQDEVVAGTSLYVRILDRDASDPTAVLLVGFVIAPEIRRSLLVQSSDTNDVLYAENRWDGQSFSVPIVGHDDSTRPSIMLSSDSKYNDTIYTKLRSSSPADNVTGCRNLFASQPYLTKGFNKPDTAALNWSALRNVGSGGSKLTAATADQSEPPCPTTDQQARSNGASDLIDIDPIGRIRVDIQDQLSARTANLTQFEIAFRAKNLDLGSAGLGKFIRVASDSDTAVSGLTSDPQPYDTSALADLFRSYSPRYISNSQPVSGVTAPVKIILGTHSYTGFVTFGPDNTIVALSIGSQPLPAIALLSSDAASK